MDLHRDVLAAAEGAADPGEVDAHPLGGKAEAGRDLSAVDVEPLGGDVDVDPAFAVGHGETRLRPASASELSGAAFSSNARSSSAPSSAAVSSAPVRKCLDMGKPV